MSVETSKVEGTTPAVPKTEPTGATTLADETATAAGTTEGPSTTPATTDAVAPVTDEPKKGETVVESVPASEGVLGYKAPGFLKQFHFSKHHFWFSDEAVPAESVSQIKEKHGHEHAAWARETGKGALFFSKRAEDKSTPSGMILLHEASNVVKDGFDSFSVKVGTQVHRFEAASSRERDAWILAFEKKLEEAKGLKDHITGRDTYKKNVEDYTKPTLPGTGAAAGVRKDRSKSKEPKKSLDATTATAASTTQGPESKIEETPAPVVAPVEEKKTEKERSQSRKRASIFASLLNKKDEQKTEEKKEDKAEKKAEKEAIKEEKKIEAEVKKEEARETHAPAKAVEAAEASVVAAAPAVVIPTDKKEEDKTEATTPTDKKVKRSSVFGSFFGKKNVTSPSAEKSEAEANTSAKDTTEVPPVSETAPVIDEPIDTKPIDAAAVTAPTAVETAEEPTKDTTATPIVESTPKTEKKGNFLAGLIKKVEGKKDEPKDEKAAEKTTDDASPTVGGTTDGTAETPTVKEERPANEKRRTSLFGGLGTLKKKSDKKEETAEPTEGINGHTETKREKSPLPNKLGGLFRRPSKAVKSDSPTTTEPTTETTPAVTETKDTSAGEPLPQATDSKIIGDVVPDTLHAQSVSKTETAPAVKASA